jgi:hypothetical protein
MDPNFPASPHWDRAENKESLLFHSVTFAWRLEGHFGLLTRKSLIAVQSKVEDYKPNSNLHLGGVNCDQVASFAVLRGAKCWVTSQDAHLIHILTWP